MAKEVLSSTQKKEWAKVLFLNSNMTQKDIALKVGISQNSISKWVDKEKWDILKTTLTTTAENELRSLYKQLGLLNKQNEAYLEDDDPDTNPDYDRLRKLTKSIFELQNKKSGMGDIYLLMMDFITFINRDNMEDAKIVNNYADAFIKDRLNRI